VATAATAAAATTAHPDELPFVASMQRAGEVSKKDREKYRVGGKELVTT
jgi:hypothetical protein